MSLFDQFSRPVVIGHRGDKVRAPENTLAAFKSALNSGADGIEFDVKLSSDGIPFILHDFTIDRTTDGEGFYNHMTIEKLKSLDAGSWFGPEFAGERIPTLAELFEAIGNQLIMDIELTNYNSPRDGLVEKVVEVVRNYHLEGSVFFTSFYPPNLRRAKELLPEVPTGLLASDGWNGFLSRSRFLERGHKEMVLPYYTDISPAFMQHQKLINRRVYTWTVNDPADMRRLIEMGVGGIITDDPLLASRTLEAE